MQLCKIGLKLILFTSKSAEVDFYLMYRDIYKTLVGIYLLGGLVLLSLTLTVYYDIPQLNLGLHLHRHRYDKFS
jgi:hypothetical protein